MGLTDKHLVYGDDIPQTQTEKDYYWKINRQQPCDDAVSRKDVHDMLENLPVTVENKWFNWLQKACIRLAELPSVASKEKSDYVDGEAFILDMLRKEIELIPVNCKESELIIKRMLETIDWYEEGFVLPFTRK